MKFDLLSEITIPPFLQRTESEAYADTLAEAELADQLGFRCVWLAEHHFMRQHSHCSKPDLMLAALAQRTSRIRLGMGTIPVPYHHPVHLAERVATLDILTGARLEVALGRGFASGEYEAFGVPMKENRARTWDTLEILRASFARQPVNFRSNRFLLENTTIVPHVVQSPHPPLWSTATSPENYAMVAQQNMGMLASPFKPWLMTRYDIKNYLGAWNGEAPPRIGIGVSMLCLPDGKQARHEAKQALPWFYRELFQTVQPLLEQLYPSYAHLREIGRVREFMRHEPSVAMLEDFGMAIVGAPRECIELLRNFEAAGVTHVVCSIGAGAVKSDVVRESLRCIAADVMPAFRQE